MTQKYPMLYIICKKMFDSSTADAFAVSSMLEYFITSRKYSSGETYIKNLKTSKENIIRLLKILKTYENNC